LHGRFVSLGLLFHSYFPQIFRSANTGLTPIPLRDYYHHELGLSSTKWSNPMENECRTYTIEEAAKIIGIARVSAYAAVHSGTIPTLRIGKRLLVPKVALERLLSGQTAQNERCQAEPGTRPGRT
jgi:excisionase family DNA binding protein